MPHLPLQDQRFVDEQLRLLPPRIEAAKQNEVGEMMGKLKEVTPETSLRPFFICFRCMDHMQNIGAYITYQPWSLILS